MLASTTTPAEVRVCPHFGTCGGCSTLDRPYETQLAAKAAALRGIFGRDVPVLPSPVVHGYRNTMHFVTAFGAVGLREKETFKRVVDVTLCLLCSPETVAVIDAVRRGLKKHAVPDYDLLKHEGFLRYVIVREGKFTGERLVALVTNGDRPPDGFDAFLEEIRAEHNPAAFVCLTNTRHGDNAAGNVWRRVAADHIHEDMNGQRFLIGPNTFFQTNPFQARDLYRRLRDWVPAGTRFLDLYCGVGTIALQVADLCREAIGIDWDETNVLAARHNAQANNVGNARFLQQKARNFHLVAGKFDVIAVDPPRSGMGKKEIVKILRHRPDRILYVSCNAETQKSDMDALSAGYDLVHHEAYDFFPHTPHIETLAVLDRKSRG